MASKADRLITEALGHPDATTKLAVTGTTVSATLDANSTYRFLCTEDTHIKLAADNDAATTADMLLVGGLPEVFVTTSDQVILNALRATTSGDLYVTRLNSRGK